MQMETLLKSIKFDKWKKCFSVQTKNKLIIFSDVISSTWVLESSEKIEKSENLKRKIKENRSIKYDIDGFGKIYRLS